MNSAATSASSRSPGASPPSTASRNGRPRSSRIPGCSPAALGDTSDVVSKEMYTFEDRGGESVTLRPENTAGVCRALVSNGLTQSSLPRKVFYAGPMFRYERPQKGRYRQFHQIGIEVLGAAEPLADAEVIACGWHIQQELGIDEGTMLEINTLGDAACREAYRAALVGYFTAHREALSGRQPDAAGEEPAAHPRQQGRKAPRARRRCADHLRPPDPGGRRLLRHGAAPPDQLRRALPDQSADRAGARLLQPHRLRIRHRHGSARRAPSWPAAAITAWSRKWAARPPPAVGWAAGVERLSLLLEAAG